MNGLTLDFSCLAQSKQDCDRWELQPVSVRCRGCEIYKNGERDKRLECSADFCPEYAPRCRYEGVDGKCQNLQNRRDVLTEALEENKPFRIDKERLKLIEEDNRDRMRYMERGRVFKHEKHGWYVVREDTSQDMDGCDTCACIEECKTYWAGEPAPASMRCCEVSRIDERNVYYHKLTPEELSGGMKVEGLAKPKKMLEAGGWVGVTEFTKYLLSFNEGSIDLFIPNTIFEVE